MARRRHPAAGPLPVARVIAATVWGGDIRPFFASMAAISEMPAGEATDRGLDQIAFVQGDVTALPLDGGVVDLILSYWGLHCLDEPEAALDEAVRVLRPGGRVIGASFISGTALRQRLLVHPHRGAFGEVPDESTLSEWLGSRFATVELEVSGPFAYFSAQRRATPTHNELDAWQGAPPHHRTRP